MARRTNKSLGKAAKVLVLAMYLHPAILISITLPNIETNHSLEDYIVVRVVVKKVNQNDQLVVVMNQDSFKAYDRADCSPKDSQNKLSLKKQISS